jgi:Fe2+ or Zn2+ uptake regulation protein
MTYYNTNNEEGANLLKSRMNTQKQEDVIYLLFNDDVHLSPDMIKTLLVQDYPITSIRRALTNLTDKGLLKKTNEMVMGKYGKKTHTWKLAESEV